MKKLICLFVMVMLVGGCSQQKATEASRQGTVTTQEDRAQQDYYKRLSAERERANRELEALSERTRMDMERQQDEFEAEQRRYQREMKSLQSKW